MVVLDPEGRGRGRHVNPLIHASGVLNQRPPPSILTTVSSPNPGENWCCLWLGVYGLTVYSTLMRVLSGTDLATNFYSAGSQVMCSDRHVSEVAQGMQPAD